MSSELIKSIFSTSLFEGVFTFIQLVVIPTTLWILLPGIVLGIIFRSKETYIIGTVLGLFAMITLGPL
ncbi:hypothetical protein M670_00410 [Schinkia azotoformans MEV2011]|uniref:Uncharacterized protein n=1 Tax=Schinkia azotoformans MEV2011 TaxID=1348973 RepID=A0A072NRP5_SCHAZ|nr:hypothetical protein [Schinkia azotoformans]KEF40384.1 hypothetical protein M670_00410 [Schinkia azotoformans MEV2011]MEC1696203.1 hypothetical protein [Schinkia azotoformans]MEC1725294.1 hypothetical protein [Schinkia azotoformans]